MKLLALTRAVPPSLAACELTFLPRRPIDVPRAQEQHAAYRRLLAECGATVVALPADAASPDSCFVEDTAVVVDELAVVTRPGASSRRGETAAVAEALAAYRRVVPLEPPATLDGGDVLAVGRRLYAGLSTRTNAAGIEALRAALGPLGHEVVPVDVRGSLHLKTAVIALDDETLLANPAWVDLAPFAGLRVLPVPGDEPWAANVLRLGASLCLHSGSPRTLDLLRGRGLDARTVDVSEFLKAEAGVTCLSLVFRDAGGGLHA